MRRRQVQRNQFGSRSWGKCRTFSFCPEPLLTYSLASEFFKVGEERMGHTIFILGTDPQQCKELREILQERISDNIVMAHREDDLPNIKESDTVIITSEEKNTGILYRRLLNRLEDQVHRAELLSDLIRLFSSSVQIDELLDRVVSRSTDVLGDISFIVLSGEDGLMRLESAFSKDQEQLVKMLIKTGTIS